MKTSKLILILTIITAIIIGVLAGVVTIINNNKVAQEPMENEQVEGQVKLESSIGKVTGNKVPDGYIAVFHGGVGERTYETYIYKENNGHDNYGFDYVNTTSTTSSWGSSSWNVKVTKQGSVMWTDDVFKVAEKNNAYSYVTVPNSSKTYSIEDFMKMFLMN